MTKKLFVALACVAGLAHAGDLYRWTDAQGVLHFSDTPPPQNQVNPAQVKIDRDKISEADSTLYATPKPGAAQNATPQNAPSNSPASATAQRTPAANDNSRICDQARSNVQLLQGSYPVADASGKVLDDKARADMLEQAKRTVATCR